MQGQQPDECRQRDRGRQQQPGAAILAQPEVRQVAADDLGQRGGDEQQQGFHSVLSDRGNLAMPDDLSRLRARRCASSLSRKRGRISPSPVYGRRCPKSLPTNALVGGADEGTRAKRLAAFDVCCGWVSGKSSSLR